jgi:hypothetical protein
MDEGIEKIEHMFQPRLLPVQYPKDQPETDQRQQIEGEEIDFHISAATSLLVTPGIEIFKATDAQITAAA